MKAVIVTQAEPFYIPIFLGKVLKGSKEVIAIITLPRTPKRFTLISSAQELYNAFGLRYILAYGALFIHHKILALLSHWVQFRRFYSIESVARSSFVPVYKLKNINAPQLNLCKALKPDIIVSVAAPQICRGEIIGLPKYCSIVPCKM